MSPDRVPRRPGDGHRERPARARAREWLSPTDEPARRRLAREWAWTSATSLIVALVAGLSAMAAEPRRDTGDLLVGLYFAALNLYFWARASWIQRGRTIMPSVGGYAAALAIGLGTGGLLVAADIISGGRL
jgi:hypothetical protein